MKVTLLGTGAIYSKSNCAGILLDDNTLVDVGPGVVKYLIREKYDLSQIDTIVLTHLHFDHISDIPLLLVYLNEMKMKHRITIYGPRGTEEKIKDLTRLINCRYTDRFIRDYAEFVVFGNESVFDVHKHNFEAFEVIHGYIEAYGFIVDSKLGISGDSSLCENVKHMVRNCDTSICDSSFEVGDHHHMGIDNMLELSGLNDKATLIPTHFRDEVREKMRAMDIPGNIKIVDDGFSFKI